MHVDAEISNALPGDAELPEFKGNEVGLYFELY